jgi:hypothetical protein
VLKTVSQSQINHIVLTVLAQAGIFRAAEKHVPWGNIPVVADFIFCEYLTGRTLMVCVVRAAKSSGQIIIKKRIADLKGGTVGLDTPYVLA